MSRFSWPAFFARGDSTVTDPAAVGLRGRIWSSLKWLWIVAAMLLAIQFLARYWTQVSAQLSALGWRELLVSATAVLLGKLLLSVSAGAALRQQGKQLPFWLTLHTVSLSQLGTYLPGGVWQFLGRAGLYAEQGLSARTIVGVLIYEHTWQWGSAAVIAALLMLPHFLGQHLQHVTALLWTLGLLPALAIAWYFIFRAPARWISIEDALSVDPWSVLAIQLGAWACLGVSFWVLIPMEGELLQGLYVVGLFAAASLVGFLVPIAPAGLGVREAVLAAGLAPFMPMTEAVTYAAVNRLVWIAVEVGLVLVTSLAAACRFQGQDDSGRR